MNIILVQSEVLYSFFILLCVLQMHRVRTGGKCYKH